MYDLFLSGNSSISGSIPNPFITDDARRDSYPFSSWVNMIADTRTKWETNQNA